MIGSSKESTMNYTAKQMAAIAEFCGYATKVNPEGDRIHPHQLIIHEKLHNDDSTDGRLDLTVVALTSEIVVRATIDCYGNGGRSHGLVEWVHSDDWDDLLDTLRTHDGPVILTARADDGGEDLKARVQKDLPYDVDVVVQASAHRNFSLRGVRSVRFKDVPGAIEIGDLNIPDLLDVLTGVTSL